LSEEQAVQFLGLASKYNLKDAFREGLLPHVIVEHGNRFENMPHPFNKHRFFFVQKEENPVSRPSIDFVSWVAICKSLEEGKPDALTPSDQARIRDYTGYSDAEDAYPDLKSTHGILSSSELSGEDGDDGYRYGSPGGRQRSSSKGPSSSPDKADGEVYTRADGKRVRRVKRANSGVDDALLGVEAKNDNSQRVRRIVRSNSSHAGSSDNLSPLVSKDEKGDGPKVRRIRRSNSSHVGSTHSRGGSLADEKDNSQRVRRINRSSSSHSGLTGKAGLAGFLAKDENDDNIAKEKMTGSRSVGAGEGEIFTRGDGKKGE
jgi:hypothetical protein